MPHECASCGHAFPDGSKEMLSGCPECGGNKFQFIPAGTGGETESTEARSAKDSSFDFAGDADPASNPEGSDDIIVADEEPLDEREDRAQASARSAVVSEDELPPSDLPPSGGVDTGDEHSASEGETSEGETSETDDRPDLSELREELNDQFESIKILQPGEYELNLMELYDREERIIALEEDGRYAIDVPSSWHEDEDE
ncbi:MAG: Zn-ribbon containing protein [Halanaeroarchaeum sp.]